MRIKDIFSEVTENLSQAIWMRHSRMVTILEKVHEAENKDTAD